MDAKTSSTGSSEIDGGLVPLAQTRRVGDVVDHHYMLPVRAQLGSIWRGVPGKNRNH